MLVAILLVLVALVSAVALLRWPTRWAQLTIWLLVLQNAVVIAIWKISGSDDVARNLLYAKEAVVGGGALMGVILVLRAVRAGRVPLVIWIAVAFGVLCAIWVPISYARQESLEQIARGLRSLAYPVALLVIGALAVTGLQAALAVRRTLWWTAIVLGVSAVIERSFIPLSFWLSIGLDQYWITVRGQSADMLNGGLPWNFYLPVLGSVVRRAFGIMTDPLGLSYFLLLPLGLAVAETWRARRAGERLAALPIAAAVACVFGLTFSLSRMPIAAGAVLAVAAPLVALGLAAGRWRQAVGWAAATGVAFGAVLIVSLATTPKVDSAAVAARAPLDLGSDGSHVASLLRVSDIRPLLLGNGLGTAGYLSAKFADSPGEISYENPYFDAAAQVGALGGILLAALLVLSSVLLLRARGPGMVVTLPAGAVLGILAAAGFISGQLEVITSLGATWLFTGMALSLCAPSPVREGAAGRDRVEPSLQRDRPSPVQR